MRSLFLGITLLVDTSIILFLNSDGLPIPYIQETEATTITSRLPDSSADVADSLSFSISSLICKSFSI